MPITITSIPGQTGGATPAKTGGIRITKLGTPSQPSTFQNVMIAGKNFAEGVAKSEGDVVQNVSKLGAGVLNKGVNPFLNAMGVKTQTAQPLLNPEQEQILKSQGTAQTAGKIAGNVAQFFVPSGAEEDAYNAIASHIDDLPKALSGVKNITPELAKGIADGLKILTKGAITGVSTAGVTAAQTGDMQQAKQAGVIGTAAGGVSEAINIFGKGIGDALQKSGFKLSPVQEAKAATKAENAASFMTDNKITGLTDESKYKKLTTINNNLEATLQAALPDTLKVNKNDIINTINTSIEKLKTDDPAIYKTAKNDANEAIDLLKTKEGDTISAKDVLKAKRSYGSQAFRQSKFAVTAPGVVSEGSYAVEQAFQKGLDNTLAANNQTIEIPQSMQSMFGGSSETTLSNFNKIYSNAISAKNLTGLARFKNDSGLVGRMFGLWVGESVGESVFPGLGGKILGGATGEIASNKIPSLVRNVGEMGVANPEFATKMAKTDLGTQNAQQ